MNPAFNGGCIVCVPATQRMIKIALIGKVLKEMDVPPLRMELTQDNLRWLSRNLGIRNSQHQHYNAVTNAINSLIE